MLNKCRAKWWYLDGTYKIVKESFTQLSSIHAFVKSESSIKQLPLVFVLMSGKRKRDYKKAHMKLQESPPGSPAVKSVVLDFESALWKVFPNVYPGVELQGCSFHWTQAVWRKIQLMGLQPLYLSNHSTHDFCRKLMALTFLPCEHIEPAFRILGGHVSNDIEHQLITYIDDTSIAGQWKLEDWCVFNHTVRTNNDVEGWYLRTNSRARRGQLNFKESQIITLQLHLVSQSKLKRYHRVTYRKM